MNQLRDYESITTLLVGKSAKQQSGALSNPAQSHTPFLMALESWDFDKVIFFHHLHSNIIVFKDLNSFLHVPKEQNEEVSI